MAYKICLSRGTVLFYSILLPVVSLASLSNLIGMINHTNTVTGIGVFSLFGFIVLPVLIIASYRSNLLTIDDRQVRIGKKIYPRDGYKFAIKDYTLPFKERPLFSPHRKVYSKLSVKSNRGGFVQTYDMDISTKNIQKIREQLSL